MARRLTLVGRWTSGVVVAAARGISNGGWPFHISRLLGILLAPVRSGYMFAIHGFSCCATPMGATASILITAVGAFDNLGLWLFDSCYALSFAPKSAQIKKNAPPEPSASDPKRAPVSTTAQSRSKVAPKSSSPMRAKS
jgi:hypothetical protein